MSFKNGLSLSHSFVCFHISIFGSWKGEICFPFVNNLRIILISDMLDARKVTLIWIVIFLDRRIYWNWKQHWNWGWIRSFSLGCQKKILFLDFTHVYIYYFVKILISGTCHSIEEFKDNIKILYEADLFIIIFFYRFKWIL